MKRAQRKATQKKYTTQNGDSVAKNSVDAQNGRQLRSAKAIALSGIANCLANEKDTGQAEAVKDVRRCVEIEQAKNIVADSETSPVHAQTLKRRINLTRFLYKSKSDIPPHVLKTEHDSDDFETPIKKIKRAPKLSQPAITTKSSEANRVQRNKRQQKITTAFLRTEQMFSEIAAQHSIAENFNPDEVQLALALSRSEVDAVNSNENALEISKKPTAREEELIRDKLKKFGFRTANREDYTNCFATAFLNGQRRTKTKWANKFTALTLRDPKAQAKKLIANIEGILKHHFKSQLHNSCDPNFNSYKVHSQMLSQHVVDGTAQTFRNVETLSVTEDLERFFVKELFPVTQLPAGHLLKDWTNIPGRDLSPERAFRRLSVQARKYQKFYAELEACFSKNPKDRAQHIEGVITSLVESGTNEETPIIEIHSLSKSLETNEEESVKSPKNASKSTEEMGSFLGESRTNELDGFPKSLEKAKAESVKSSNEYSKEADEMVSLLKNSPANEVTPMNELVSLSEPLESSKMISSVVDVLNLGAEEHTIAEKNVETKPTSITEPCPNTQPQTRPTSPDLFADSDSDADIVEENQLNNITTYEVYSSDDVKTSSEAGYKTNLLSVKADVIVDLTQDDGSAEGKGEKEFEQITTPKKHESFKRLDFLDIPNITRTSNLEESPTLFAEYEANSKHEAVRNTSIGKLLTESKELNCSLMMDNAEDDSKNCSVVKGNKSREDNRTSSIASIDLTQSDQESMDECTENDNENDDDVCILLSDDEVNYSIIKANAVFSTSATSNAHGSDNSNNGFDEESVSQQVNSFEGDQAHNFSVLDLVDVGSSFQLNEQNERTFEKNVSFNLSGDTEPINEEFLATQFQIEDCPTTPVKALSVSDMLKQQRAEFGILESQSETFSQTSPHWIRTPMKVATPSSADIHEFQQQRYSRHSNTQKIQSFLFEPPKTPVRDISNGFSQFDDFDEFDRLVYGSPPKRVPDTVQPDVPTGLTQLLTAEISLNAQCLSTSPASVSSVLLKSMTPEKAAQLVNAEEEIKINDHVYTVRVTNSPKPNFEAQTDSELLKQLYNFGIKPLKRHQAIKLLEYIYNETHPIIGPSISNEGQTENDSENGSDLSLSTEKERSSNVLCNENYGIAVEDGGKMAVKNNWKKLNLRDCSGDQLLRFCAELSAELRNDEEVFIFQTNVTKKIQQPLLPLHIAWYNLVCANTNLHESILMYEPIDLQEIYLFLKNLGYRFDPKDLKSFFDRRCIIFRYDLTPADKQANRHTRKPNKTTSKTQKCANTQRTLHKYFSN